MPKRTKEVVVIVEGGCLRDVLGVDEYTLVDYDNIKAGDPPPTLPEGYHYDTDGDVVEE
jgi:hypothetical protein